MKTARYASKSPLSGLNSRRWRTSGRASLSGTSPGLRKKRMRIKLIMNARNSRSQIPKITAGYAAAAASDRFTSNINGNHKTFHVGVTLYAAIMRMIKKKLEAKPRVSVIADAVGMSIRSEEHTSELQSRF